MGLTILTRPSKRDLQRKVTELEATVAQLTAQNAVLSSQLAGQATGPAAVTIVYGPFDGAIAEDVSAPEPHLSSGFGAEPASQAAESTAETSVPTVLGGEKNGEVSTPVDHTDDLQDPFSDDQVIDPATEVAAVESVQTSEDRSEFSDGVSSSEDVLTDVLSCKGSEWGTATSEKDITCEEWASAGWGSEGEWDAASTAAVGDWANEVTAVPVAEGVVFGEVVREPTMAGLSRLDDGLTGPAMLCSLPGGDQSEYISSAHGTAQEVMFVAVDESHHEKREKWWDSKKQVLFGYGDLDTTIGKPGSSNNIYYELRGANTSDMNKAIEAVIKVRNAWAHGHLHQASELDALLRSCQNLACVLKDGRAAYEIREIRDKLRDQANSVLEEIKTSHEGTGVPQWQMYHQRTLDLVKFKTRKELESLPAYLQQAAEKFPGL